MQQNTNTQLYLENNLAFVHENDGHEFEFNCEYFFAHLQTDIV